MMKSTDARRRARATLGDPDRNGIIDDADAEWSLNYFASLDPYQPIN